MDIQTTTIDSTEQAQAVLGVKPVTQGPSMTEQTRGQVSIYGATIRQQAQGLVGTRLAPLLRDISNSSSWHYRKVREMRKHPTIKLARMLSISAMAAAGWSIVVEDDAPKGSKELINNALLNKQHQFMSVALRGNFDFGWQPFEKVLSFSINEETGLGEIGLRKLKPLLQDQTQIVVETKTGEFAGFKQFDTYLSLANSVLINQDVEGTYWYGESTMLAIQLPYDRWLVTDAANTRYDHKISGAHWVIYYPVGWTLVDGVDTDNHTIANNLLRVLEGSGSICIPSNVMQTTNDLNNVRGEEAWKIDLMTADASAQSGFGARLSYLDSLIVRGAEFPERSILEGQYGTKAEAGEHADFAVARMDWRNNNIEDQINEQVVNQLLIINYGQKAKSKVKLKIAEIADDKKDLVKQLYMQYIGGMGGSGEQANVDWQAIRDQLEIPTVEKTDMHNPNMLPNMLANLQQPDDPNAVPPSEDSNQPPQGNLPPQFANGRTPVIGKGKPNVATE